MRKFAALIIGFLIVVTGLSETLASFGESGDNGYSAVVINLVSVEQKLKIELEENASTGYVWEWEAIAPESMSLFSKEIISNSESSDEVDGAPARVTWLFSPSIVGRSTIVMRLFRPWEGKEAAIDIRVYNIIVEDEFLNECRPQYVYLLDPSSANVSQGGVVEVAIEGIKSEVSNWDFTLSNPDVIQFLEKRSLECDEDRPVIGAGLQSKTLFRFLTVDRGTCLLRFHNALPEARAEDMDSVSVFFSITSQ